MQNINKPCNKYCQEISHDCLEHLLWKIISLENGMKSIAYCANQCTLCVHTGLSADISWQGWAVIENSSAMFLRQKTIDPNLSDKIHHNLNQYC